MYRFIIMLTLLIMTFAIGVGTGYVAGYSDRYAEVVVKYRRGR
jgi:hypothetical protein